MNITKWAKSLFKSEERHAMPSRRIEIRFSDDALQDGTSGKTVEVFQGNGRSFCVPFVSYAAVAELEKSLGIAVLDTTGRKSVPKDGVAGKVYRPDAVEVARF